VIPRHRRWRRLLRIGVASCALAVVLCVVGVVAAWRMAAASLARSGGEVSLAGLSAPVEASIDDLGSPEIVGETLLDVVRAQGFLDAQERFFQMDLARRYAAGELSGLLGRAALFADRDMARYLFRTKAVVLLPTLPERHRAMLEAYTAGVNAGLDDLGARPPEYFLLRATPETWTPEDSLLAMYAMFRGLNFNDYAEKRLAVMRDALPEAVFEFLTPDYARDDASLLVPDPEAHAAMTTPLAIPGPEVVDLRERAPAEIEAPIVEEAPKPVGSNNFAVASSRTTDGRAILANDMHLGLSVPPTWRRVTLRWGDRFATGVSLPGVPGVVAGSNGRVAWGYTNVYGDFQDYRVIEVNPADPNQYRTRSGWDEFTEAMAEIPVKGDETERIPMRSTRYGLVIDEDHRGRPMVLDWAAMHPDKTNLGILDMLEADGLEEAIEVARRWFGPPQNVLIASHDGRIAWVMSGWLPNRVDYDGRTPTLAHEHRWEGALDESLRPMVIDPPEGALSTANNRVVGLPDARRFGREWGQGDRAKRIGELLLENGPFDEAGLFEMQLDTRVAGLDVWRDLALEAAERSGLDDARALLASWNGHADIDQTGYRLIRAFRSEAMDRALEPLLAPCRELDPDFTYRWTLSEEPALRLIEERPAHLLDPAHGSWEALLDASLRAAVDDLESDDLPINAPWGAANRSALRHPLTAAVPQLRPLVGWLLDMPRRAQAGDVGAVRVARPSFGASQRLVVSPGHEADGALHLPAGNSGHPLSAHYGDQFDDWIEGRATPLLPGEPKGTLRFTPTE